MASHVFVLDSTFKRTQVKVTPGMSLREILEQACRTRKLSPDGYILKTQTNKTLDLSQPFRLSGLSAGAKLTLTQASKSPGVVSVALQLPESEGSGRLSDKFPSSTSLWLVLRKYEDAVAGPAAKKLNLTQRGVASSSTGAGRLMYEQPCLHVVGRNYESFQDLQKTLAQLGLNGGSALLRLSFRPSEQPLEEAMKEISEYFTSIDAQSAKAESSTTPSATDAQAGATVASESEPKATDTDSPMTNVEPQPDTKEDVEMTKESISQPNENQKTTTATEAQPPAHSTNDSSASAPSQINGISVYRPPSSNTPAAALAPDDPTVFEPTVDHAKAHQAALNRASRPQRLASDKELEDRATTRAAELSTIHNVAVRVRYPDQSQIELNITATETAADLHANVMQTLAAAPEPFELRYAGAQRVHQVLPNDPTKRLIRDCGFRGKMMVTLVWAADASAAARKGPSLKDEYRRHATELKVELAGQQREAETAHRAALEKKDKDVTGGSGSGSRKTVDVEAKMKKFLGFGKK